MKRSFPALLGLLFATCASTPLFANFQFSATGGSQSFTVPTDGLYEVTGFGAQGGNSLGGTGGLGAEIDGFFNFLAGDVLTIDVGVAGGSSAVGIGGGGGGGTFIIRNGGTLLMVAGGGGGANDFVSGIGGVTTQAGTSGTGSGGTSAAGLGGGGGTAISSGGGGGGYTSNGGAGTGIGSPGGGGFGFPTLTGGAGQVAGVSGGYGGGGGGGGESGGGGGGYGGGGGGGWDGGNDGAGGGGGSFVDVSVIGTPTLIGAENTGDGLVDISQGPFIPEPASFGLIAIGLLGMLAFRRRRLTLRLR